MIIAVNGLVTGPNGERGVAGAGKDEVAQRLVKKHGFVAVALADPMKRFCQDVYEFSDEQLWGPSGERNKPDERYLRTTVYAPHMLHPEELEKNPTGELPQYLTPRHALQQLGTEWGRECFKHTWVDYTLRIHSVLQGGDFYYDQHTGLRHWASVESSWVKAKVNVVVPDVRFVNELERIQQAGGKVVRVKRHYQTLPGFFAGHLSETELLNVPDEKFDFVIQNLGTLEDLYQAVDIMMEELHEK